MIPPKVLIVDDEKEFVEALADRLSLRGFETVTASDGQNAMEMIETEPNIEVVLLDLRMPGPDGIEVLSRIKEKQPLVEVILMSGHGSVSSGVECMKKGAFHFLEKPVDTEELATLIETAAHRNRANQNTVVSIRSRYKKPSNEEIENLDPFVRKALGYDDERQP